MTKSKVALIALAALVLVASAVVAVWVASGRDAATIVAAAPARCLDTRVNTASAHPGMVYVPGGAFDMGDTVYPEERPIRPVRVEGFWMDIHEVTNDEFAAFVAATGYVTVAERDLDPAAHPDLPPDLLKAGAVVFVMPNDVNGSGNVTQWWQYIAGANWRHPGGPHTNIEGRGAYPVVAVAAEDVTAYADWKGRKIPSEAQWEWAARGGSSTKPDHDQPKDANSWQGIFPVINTAEDGFVGLAPVGCYKANAHGLYDMLGNVWEFTSDQFGGSASSRVIKGGSYLCAPNYCMRYRPGARQAQEVDLAASHLGFRTILEAAGP
jgi:formylglycine-generating enzyme required for sulfatase activity